MVEDIISGRYLFRDTGGEEGHFSGRFEGTKVTPADAILPKACQRLEVARLID